jgi:TolB protein
LDNKSAEVYVMNVDGTADTAHHERVETHPSSSPDSNRAFQSNRDGNFEIYTMNADGSGVMRLTRRRRTRQVPLALTLTRLVS